MNGRHRRTLRASDGAARREHRRLARAKLAELRAKLRDALHAKQVRMREIVAECRAQRIGVRTQIREMRAEALREIRERAQRERAEARDACLARKRQARQDFDSAIAVARAELAAEKQRQADERRIAREERARHAAVKKAHATGAAHHGVRATMLGPLAPIAARVREIAPGESRAEAVLRYAETHAEEAHAVMHPVAERAIADVRAQVVQVERGIDAPTAAELERAVRSAKRRRATSGKGGATADPEALRRAIWDAHAAARSADKRRQRRLAQFEKGDGKRSYQELRDSLVAAEENLTAKSNAARVAEEAFRAATGHEWGDGAGNAPDAGLTRPAAGTASPEASPAAGIGESGPGQPPRAPNPYEARRAERIARLRKRADQLDSDARVHEDAVRAAGDRTALLGHHGDKRYWRGRKQIDHHFRASFDRKKSADALRRRAARAEASTAVLGDNPAALSKLLAKLAELEAKRAKWKAAHAAIRAGTDARTALEGLHVPAATMDTFDEMARNTGRTGVPAYIFQNLGAEARRVTKRIKELEERAARPERAPETIGGAHVFEADNSVRVAFPAKPPEPVRRALKGAGFRWAPSVNAWQRRASVDAWTAARRVLESEVR